MLLKSASYYCILMKAGKIMKILVCTDGSEQSRKALEKAADIASGCKVDEIAILHVYDNKPDNYLFYWDEGSSLNKEQLDQFQKIREKDKDKRKNILLDALKFFEDKGIKARTIFKEGHPSHTITKVAEGEGFDMIVIGSRGLGGLNKIFLGSVSSAVVQEARNCSVLTVK